MAARKGLEFIHVELKRDTWMNPDTIVQTPNDAVDIIKGMLEDMDREMLVCINLASSGRVINASICSVGTMDQALVSPPEILRGALLSGARGVIMLHNHPSGSLTPSKEDIQTEVERYIMFFNEERPAYSLNYLTPKQYKEYHVL